MIEKIISKPISSKTLDNFKKKCMLKPLHASSFVLGNGNIHLISMQVALDFHHEVHHGNVIEV